MASPLSVLVAAEVTEGKLSPTTRELLGCARGLAGKLGGEVGCALLGSGVAGLAAQLIAHGADRVVVADAPGLKDYLSDSYTGVMEAVVKQTDPQIVLLGHTSQGRDLGPRLAFRLGAGLATDCVELDIDGASKRLLATRPVYGGNARATFSTETRPQMATVRSKAMSPLPADPSRKGETVALSPLPPTASRAALTGRAKEEVKGVKLEDASVVVSGGRGVGGVDGFKQLEELARTLKGAVGATRAACDNGWWPASAQVGLTGKIVAPDLYIAVALSGSSQHMAGCSGSKTIVAINKDPEANIFKEAQYGAVGDYRQLLPAFARRVKELLEK
ncbi:MAG: electron transfer flavoprotein subunit alpha/FixB family protein [Chloroflexota bacterium]